MSQTFDHTDLEADPAALGWEPTQQDIDARTSLSFPFPLVAPGSDLDDSGAAPELRRAS
jgi:hypothetical protein